MADSKQLGQKKEFTGGNIKIAFGDILKAYKSGKLDHIKGTVVIEVSGEQMSPGEKDWHSKKAV